MYIRCSSTNVNSSAFWKYICVFHGYFKNLRQSCDSDRNYGLSSWFLYHLHGFWPLFPNKVHRLVRPTIMENYTCAQYRWWLAVCCSLSSVFQCKFFWQHKTVSTSLKWSFFCANSDQGQDGEHSEWIQLLQKHNV